MELALPGSQKPFGMWLGQRFGLATGGPPSLSDAGKLTSHTGADTPPPLHEVESNDLAAFSQI